MSAAIVVENLAKSYRVNHEKLRGYRTLRESLSSAALAPLRRLRNGGADNSTEDFWALNDVNFEVQPGEVVGIIGRNGAGKSTLLKILSRITKPTRGRVTLNGRVGSLLEVGTGFHPELTGRENIYMNGSILGMSRAEIASKFDEIVAFAEVEKFLDTPVKRYSSGMYVRLAFAVAAHLEPEILIVDEVLAVGDIAFQKKCLGKMQDVAKHGRTVLFVSHNMTAVQALCEQVIYLKTGQVCFIGNTNAGMSSYLRDVAGVKGASERSWSNDETAPGNDAVRVRAVRIIANADKSPLEITTSDEFAFQFEYYIIEGGIRLNLSIAVYNQENICVFSSPSVIDAEWNGRPFPVGHYRTECRIPRNLMTDGKYFVDLYLVTDSSKVIAHIDRTIEFEVADCAEGRGDWYGKWVGVVRPLLAWQTQLLETSV